MKRMMLLLLVLLLLPLAARTEEPALELARSTAKGFGENSISISAPKGGDLLLRVTDEYNVYRTMVFRVQAGMNTLLWDGLGENQQRIPDGDYTLQATLTADSGESYTTQNRITFQRCHQAMTFALPSSHVIYQEDDWFAEVCMIRPGTFVMEVYAADDPSVRVARRRQDSVGHDPFFFRWKHNEMAPGHYVLRFFAEDNPAYRYDIPVEIRPGSAPEIPLEVTDWFMPTAEDTDAEIWRAMMQPSCVVDLRSVSHQDIYAQPSEDARSLGTIHGQSQAVNVLEILDSGWVRVSAWNHESGDLVEGYVPRERLMMVAPGSTYGLLLDKQRQELTVFREGQRLTTMKVSTGRIEKEQFFQETPAGMFLTLEHMANFSNKGYCYDYPIRYDGGNLLHQLGYEERKGHKDFADHTSTLGRKASHGCVRLPHAVNSEGINAYWLWTHLPYHTRVIILDDPAQREEEVILTNAGLDAWPELAPAMEAPPALQEGETEIILTFGGDAVLGTREKWWELEESFPSVLAVNGMEYPFGGLQSIFGSDDMTMINLEGVLKANRSGEDKSKAWRFRGLPEYAQILPLASVEQVNIGNNHYFDYGAAGKSSTREALTAAGVPYSGYGFTYMWEHDGLRIGFAGCRETMYKKNKKLIAQEIGELRGAGCQVVVYSCHWGQEYSGAHNETQREMAQAAVEAGADLIIGGHPHVVQGIEKIGHVPVVYSLGNLMFGGTHDMTTFDAALARVKLRFSGETYLGCSLEMIPILTSSNPPENDFRPVPAQGDDAARILKKIQADTPFALTECMWYPAGEEDVHDAELETGDSR